MNLTWSERALSCELVQDGRDSQGLRTFRYEYIEKYAEIVESFREKSHINGYSDHHPWLELKDLKLAMIGPKFYLESLCQISQPLTMKQMWTWFSTQMWVTKNASSRKQAERVTFLSINGNWKSSLYASVIHTPPYRNFLRCQSKYPERCTAVGFSVRC